MIMSHYGINEPVDYHTLEVKLFDPKLPKHLRVANNTYARLSADHLANEGAWPVVTISYHETDIAEIAPYALRINTGGYDTKSTVTRLDDILTANGVPFRVCILRGQAALRHRDTLKDVKLHEVSPDYVLGVETLRFNWVEFRSVTGIWQITDFGF